MKNPLRYLSLLIFLFSALISCQKTSSFDEPPGSQYPPIFSSQEEAGQAVSRYFEKAGQGEQLVQIENVLFIESQNKTYALVYYQSNVGHSNILYEREYQNGVAEAGKTYRCSGSTCNCLVQTTISQSGSVSYDCSCTSCTMLIDNF